MNLQNIESLLTKSTRKRYCDELEKFAGLDVLIYGAGSFGREIYSGLLSAGVTDIEFLDKNAENIKTVFGRDVFTLNNYPKSRSDKIVLFSIVCDKTVRSAIISEIRASGFENVIEAQSIRCLDVMYDEIESPHDTYEKIVSAYNLLSDEKSRNIFLNNIYAHLTGDYSGCCDLEDPMSEQYFPSDFLDTIDYNVVIDCGGFIGDTIDELMKRGNSQRIISFEPSIVNYSKMVNSCKKHKDSNTEFILYNAAVSDNVCKKYFKTGTGSGTISDDGDELVFIVSLDAALQGLKPSFIKMDIEGEEINAIRGGMDMISKYSPDLAVCVYHRIDHIWRIPLLIHSLSDNYDFYLRSYNSCTMETVLYAISKKRDN